MEDGLRIYSFSGTQFREISMDFYWLTWYGFNAKCCYMSRVFALCVHILEISRSIMKQTHSFFLNKKLNRREKRYRTAIHTIHA